MGNSAQSSVCFRIFWPRGYETTESKLIPKNLFDTPVTDLTYNEGLLKDFIFPANAKVVMIVNVASN